MSRSPAAAALVAVVGLAVQVELRKILDPADRGLIRDDLPVVQVLDGAVHGSHAVRGAGLQHGEELRRLVLADQVANRRGADHDFTRQHPAGAVLPR